VANNDPSACYSAAVLGAGATITTNARSIAADDFFRGMFETALDEGEIITAVTFPTAGSIGQSAVQAANYQKFVQPASRFALVGVFVAKRTDGVRVAVTGASESGVHRWAEAEAALSSNFSADAVAGLSVSPDGMIGDLHGSPEYRAHLVGVLTGRAVAAAA
jgi:carbon-monoxide dehydrogenase medium subunit